MGRPRNEEPRERIKISFSAEQKERVEEYARAAHRPLATAITELVMTVLDNGDAATALAETQARVRELEAQLEHKQQATGEGARWTWPMRRLLADREWWDRWLPELGLILGRGSTASYDPGEPVDKRGYRDVLTLFFPPLHDTKQRAVLWHHIEYPRYARLAWENARRSNPAVHTQRSLRSEAWEPVIRHICVGLSMLESASLEGDAYLVIRAKDELGRGWWDRLEALVGQGQQRRLEALEG